MISIANEYTPLHPSNADSNKKLLTRSLTWLLSCSLFLLFCLGVKYPPIARNKLLYCLLKNLSRLSSTTDVALTVKFVTKAKIKSIHELVSQGKIFSIFMKNFFSSSIFLAFIISLYYFLNLIYSCKIIAIC